MKKKEKKKSMRAIILRGPAAVGKTTIAKRLAEECDATHVSYDDIMERHGLDTIEGDGIPAKNFIEADKLVLGMIQGKEMVILDGCFYRHEQLRHLKENIDDLTLITLDATPEECARRNSMRESGMQEKDVRDVHELTAQVTDGIHIDTSEKSIQDVIEKIRPYLTKKKK